jgi:hypothetical protein
MKGCFPLVAKKTERLGAHSHHPQGRNAEKHSEQSAELCEWAGVKNRAQRGKLHQKFMIISVWKEVKASPDYRFEL